MSCANDFYQLGVTGATLIEEPIDCLLWSLDLLVNNIRLML